MLKRVFFIDMERCPRCHQRALRMLAALTSGPIIRRILLHLKLATARPLLAPPCLEQGRFAWASS